MHCRQGKGLVLNCECQFPPASEAGKFPWKKIKNKKLKTEISPTNLVMNNKTSLRKNKFSHSIKSNNSHKTINIRKDKEPIKSFKVDNITPHTQQQFVRVQQPQCQFRSTVGSQKYLRGVRKVQIESNEPRFRGSHQLYIGDKYIYMKPNENQLIKIQNGNQIIHKAKQEQVVRNKENFHIDHATKNNFNCHFPKQSFVTTITQSNSFHHFCKSNEKNENLMNTQEIKKKKSSNNLVEVPQSNKRPVSMGKLSSFFGKGRTTLQDFASATELESVLGEEDECSEEYSEVVMSYRKIVGDQQLKNIELPGFKLTDNEKE